MCRYYDEPKEMTVEEIDCREEAKRCRQWAEYARVRGDMDSVAKWEEIAASYERALEIKKKEERGWMDYRPLY